MAMIGPKEIWLKNGNKAVIRPAQESDALALLESARITFEDGEGMVVEPDEFSKTEAEERTWIKSLNENPCELLLVAEVSRRIVGNIDFHTNKRRRLSHSGHFGMSIHPEWRSQGIGDALLKSLIEWALSVPKIEKINLNVLANNKRAIALYKKHGFRECGVGKDAIKLPTGGYLDDIAMEKFVR